MRNPAFDPDPFSGIINSLKGGFYGYIGIIYNNKYLTYKAVYFKDVIFKMYINNRLYWFLTDVNYKIFNNRPGLIIL